MKVDGSCHCGNVEFEADVTGEAIVCHCTDCQTLSGSPFRVTVPAPTSSFALRGGKLQTYKKVAASGAPRIQTFCPICGTPIYSSTEISPSKLFIRIGAIRQRDLLRPTVQIWRRSALSSFDDLGSVPGSSEQQALNQK